MRIVIDMQGAQSGSRFRGIGRYAVSFAQAVVRNRGEHEIILVLSALLPESILSIRYAFDGILPQENIRTWSGIQPIADMKVDNNKHRLQNELLREDFIYSLNPDLIHVCSLFEGFGDEAITSVGLLDKKTPVSVTLYDLIPLLNPEQYLENDINYKNYYLNKIEHLKRCSVYLSISEFSSSEALEAGVVTNKDNIFTVYGGVSDVFKEQYISDFERQNIQQKLNICRPFILFTGATDERKNIPRLLEAWSLLPRKLRNSYQIVLAGGMPSEHLEYFKQIAQKYGIQPYEICFTGYVKDDIFVKLYNLCTLYIFPSWHEGLGLPAMEAMACGAPVVGARTSSLPEVIGLEEALFDPFDVEAISLAIRKGILDKNYRDRLCEHGRVQIKKFTWDETAKKAIDAWEKVSNNSINKDFLNTIKIDNKLLLKLMRIDNTRLLELAIAISKNQSMGLMRRIHIDISCLYSEPSCKEEIPIEFNILEKEIDKIFKDYLVELVLQDQDGDYYYAQRINQISSGIDFQKVDNEPIQWQRGDVFLILDSEFSRIGENIKRYEKLENDGVRVWILLNSYFTNKINPLIKENKNYEEYLLEFEKIKNSLSIAKNSDKNSTYTLERIVTLSDDPGGIAFVKSLSEINDKYELCNDISWAISKILMDTPKACNQLFVDISELVKTDAKTGIQRVVRNILKEWLNCPPKGYQVKPVYATEEVGYRYARCFTAKFLGHSDQLLIDEPIDYMAGDIFFILDLQPTVQISKRVYYEQLRRFGISVYFLVHDLLCVRMPQYFGSGASDNFSNWLDVVKENSGVICVSKATADDFIDWINETTKHTVNTINVAWNHNGADLSMRREKHEVPKEFLEIETLQHKPSFLMVGTLEPRKGHMQVLDAFEQLWQDNKDVNLVIVGKQGWMMESFVERILAHPEIDNHLYWFSSISDDALDEIYDKCSCLIAASYGEGFGLPLVESAHHDLPIICRDIGVFKEISEDNAFYFSDDTYPESISKAVINWLMLFDQDLHPKPNRIKYLTWSESALNMLDIIINKKWYTSFKPDGKLMPNKTYDHGSHLLDFESGWSHAEECHRWTEGFKSILNFSISFNDGSVLSDMLLNFHTLGRQRILIFINGIKYFDDSVESVNYELVLKNLKLEEFNQLTIELPDATRPAQGDTRLLAFAFKSLVVNNCSSNLIKNNSRKIALAFIVKNEGQQALNMINSVSSIISFVSFVDTESNDDSKNLIEDYLLKIEMSYISTTENFTNFSDIRNLSLQSIPPEYEYILVLDADETLDVEEIEKLDQFISLNECFDGLYLPRKNFIPDGTLRDYPDFQLRLFKNKGFLYDGNVHEKPNIPFSYRPSPEQLSSVPHINHYKYLKDQSSISQRENLYRNLYKENTLKRKADLLIRLGVEIDPVSLLSTEECLAFDKPNIQSNNEYLRNLIIDTRPNIILSVGCKNLSSLACMAEALLDSGHDGVILSFEKMCPSYLAQSFMASLVQLDIQDVIIPIEFSASKLKNTLKARNILFDIIYLGTFTDFKSIKNSLKLWYPLLKDEGLIVGENPHSNGLPADKKTIYHAFFGDHVQEIDDFLIVKK